MTLKTSTAKARSIVEEFERKTNATLSILERGTLVGLIGNGIDSQLNLLLERSGMKVVLDDGMPKGVVRIVGANLGASAQNERTLSTDTTTTAHMRPVDETPEAAQNRESTRES